MNSNHMSKHPFDRREFLGIVGVAMAASAAEGPDIDLIVFNARVYTADAHAPKAEAFAIKNGRFVAVGKTSEIRSLAGKGTQTFDARQMTIVPGFINCHNHAPGNTLLYEVLVGNPFEVEFVSISSIVEKLRTKAREPPLAPGWKATSSTTPS